MGTQQPVESMIDSEVLATFDTAEDPARRGFDEVTHTRVMAYELVRTRNRLSYYRALYAAFLEAGKPYMIENLDDDASDGGIPAKLVFTDDVGHVREIEEPELLGALVQERAVLDYFTELLDELEPAVQEP
jgi:hypothetical protein